MGQWGERNTEVTAPAGRGLGLAPASNLAKQTQRWARGLDGVAYKRLASRLQYRVGRMESASWGQIEYPGHSAPQTVTRGSRKGKDPLDQFSSGLIIRWNSPLPSAP